jgi:tRNA A-37 threonylcarbamoyl transferase component Bud32
MHSNKTLAQGAEAIITLENNQITKNRIKKSYRIPTLDERLRKSRTKSEAKIINKLQNIIPVPKIIKSDDKKEIIMEYINGKKLSDNLENLNYQSICKQIAENIEKIHNNGIIHGDLTTSNMIYVEENSDNINNKLKESNVLAYPDLATNNKINNIFKESEKTANNSLAIDNKNSAKLSSKRRQLSINNQSSNSEIANSKSNVFFIDFGLAFHSQKIEDKAVDLHLLRQALEAKHFTICQVCWKIILDNYKPEKRDEILNRIKIIESRGRYKEKY